MRLPTLADRFVVKRFPAEKRYISQDTLDALQRKTRAARKFIFDDEAIKRVAHVIRDVPDLLVREYAFARAPFELTWIEFPHWTFWLECNPKDHFDSKLADHTIGFLIDHGTVSSVTGGTVADPTIGPYPAIIQYRLNTEWPVTEQNAFAAIGEGTMDVLDRFLWGSTYNHLDKQTREELRGRSSVFQMPGLLNTDAANQVRATLATIHSRGAGEFRLILALLLMLNRPNLARLTETPGGSGLYRGKNMVYQTHTSVTIDLDPVPELRAEMASGSGALRRRHEVRGHYCHDATAREYGRIAGCIHDWLEMNERWEPLSGTWRADRVNHWVCQACAGKRWWKTEHTRGDATLGFVSHDDYRVVG